jgi:hypothetical protein
MKSVRIQLAVSAVMLALAIASLIAAWHLTSTWMDSGPVPDVTVAKGPQVSTPPAAPRGPVDLTRWSVEDVLGEWSGYWNSTWAVRFTIKRGAAQPLAVLEEWEQSPGQPFLRRQYVANLVGNVLTTGNRQIRITFSDKDRNSAIAVGDFDQQLTAPLIRGRASVSAKWIGSGRPSAAMQPIALDIKAQIDGSDVLRIMPHGAVWTHGDWQWPTDITLNRVAWDAQAHPVWSGADLEKIGLADADLTTAGVISRSGRDTVVMENTDDGIAVYFDDSPSGSAPYEIKIGFARRSTTPPPVTTPSANAILLDLKAAIAGDDVLNITPRGATWRHDSRNWPSNVTFNGVPWDVRANPMLENTGLANADLLSATVVSRTGRDTVAMEKTDDGIAIYFDNAPDELDSYEIQIRFRQK